MKNFYVFITALLVSTFTVFAQVGIGTVNPSPASMLEVSSTADGGSTYKGFMPPRLETQADRSLINASSTDIGLIVFVVESGTLEVWNGVNWETMYTLSTKIKTLASQDFDSNLTWNYTNSPDFYYFPDKKDFWGTVSSLNADADINIDLVSGNFLGCRDLDNPNGGNPDFHVISFVNINVSSLINGRLAFDYDVFGFDGNNDVEYIIYFDNAPQTTVLLIDGSNGGGVTEQGTVVENILAGTTNVRLDLRIKQNGDDDYAGFDNFRVYGQ